MNVVLNTCFASMVFLSIKNDDACFIIPVSIPRDERLETNRITDNAMVNKPKSLTVSFLETMSTARKPNPAAKRFPVNTDAHCLIDVEFISFATEKDFMVQM
ncbi:MAG: hypothetical protein A3G70_00840 [Planctomycetes bacterium RIFCSPLOWO2_12_FULL_39_13]|nr:MAG: hypothetical protein A3G70_00840 [Planctomycetes bacterium RIFCSPLOWO2_12_FULL_39_13]